MRKVSLNHYSPIISDKEIGNAIFQQLDNIIKENEKVELDLSSIKSMATFCAKQIFGRLYIVYGPSKFFEYLIIKNASDDLKTIIRIGIESAIEDDSKTN
jgi:hypothetical protein